MLVTHYLKANQNDVLTRVPVTPMLVRMGTFGKLRTGHGTVEVLVVVFVIVFLVVL